MIPLGVRQIIVINAMWYWFKRKPIPLYYMCYHLFLWGGLDNVIWQSLIIYLLNTQTCMYGKWTVPDILPLMPKHQDPLLVSIVFTQQACIWFPHPFIFDTGTHLFQHRYTSILANPMESHEWVYGTPLFQLRFMELHKWHRFTKRHDDHAAPLIINEVP